MLLSITIFHNNNINGLVCILVQHFILCTMGNRRVFGMALVSVISVINSIKEIISGPTFCSFMMPLIPGSILRSNPPMVMVSSYS